MGAAYDVLSSEYKCALFGPLHTTASYTEAISQLSISATVSKLLYQLRYYGCSPRCIAFFRSVKRLQAYAQFIQGILDRHHRAANQQQKDPQSQYITLAAMHYVRQHRDGLQAGNIDAQHRDMLLLLSPKPKVGGGNTSANTSASVLECCKSDEVERLQLMLARLKVALTVKSKSDSEPSLSASESLVYIYERLLPCAKQVLAVLKQQYLAIANDVRVANYPLAAHIRSLMSDIETYVGHLRACALKEYNILGPDETLLLSAPEDNKASYVNAIYHFKSSTSGRKQPALSLSPDSRSTRRTKSTSPYYLDLHSRLQRVGSSMLTLEFILGSSKRSFDASRTSGVLDGASVSEPNPNPSSPGADKRAGASASHAHITPSSVLQMCDSVGLASLCLYAQDHCELMYKSLRKCSVGDGSESTQTTAVETEHTDENSVSAAVDGYTYGGHQASKWVDVSWLRSTAGFSVSNLLECRQLSILYPPMDAKINAESGNSCGSTNNGVYSDATILTAGYSARDLFEGKYSAIALKSVLKRVKMAENVYRVSTAGAASTSEIVQVYSVEECCDAGFTPSQLYNAGYEISSIKLGHPDGVNSDTLLPKKKKSSFISRDSRNAAKPPSLMLGRGLVLPKTGLDPSGRIMFTGGRTAVAAATPQSAKLAKNSRAFAASRCTLITAMEMEIQR